MLFFRTLLVALLTTLLLGHLPAMGGDAQPYLGKWSNGRGETLTITAKTLRFAADKPVAYRDITRATNGKSFVLQLTTTGKMNFFSPFMRLELESREELKTEGAATFNGDAESSTTWFRD